ncbi:hypothetical protein T552_02013 [Pneumocystis carinii B80]|uniref:Signal recognition particle receptor subunit alpha homolog n=1 Tax=Pneumocystis carinii (strain B80) TaxID=1408658 RepID=A0A0W4ZIH1_PNEC8|nr:hypothetical protein T552_02013 [Pneumocystis carinii B80]KTW28154.1 hypothetical protein T552_02013 [Pneumocystis carinii B80]
MLVLFTIFNRGGIVLWERAFDDLPFNIIKNFINDIFIEEQKSKTTYIKEDLAVKWTISNEYGLVFAAVYISLSELYYVEEFLENIKKLFCQIYNEHLKKKDFCSRNYKFDSYFDTKIEEFNALNTKKLATFMSKKEEITEDSLSCKDSEKKNDIVCQNVAMSNVSETVKTRFPLKKDHQKRSTNKNSKKNDLKMGDLSDKETVKKNKKVMRKWENHYIVDGDCEDDALDYSVEPENSSYSNQNDMLDIAKENLSSKNGKVFIIKEIDDDNDETNGENDKKELHIWVLNIFTNLVKKRVLSLDDINPALTKMKELLLKKNIAKEVVDNICESVQNNLIGKNIGTFQSIHTIIKTTMESTLKQILTPSASIDLLKEIDDSKAQKRPYTISFVGFNGVGKSTTLSKIAFWLLKNHLKILVAACDTFRSGAIEQLQVHVRNLQQLSERENCGKIELFEKGYGKDANIIANNSILYAKKKEFDVVLIDTSGRRHNDTRLMSPLEKLVTTENIDKVFQVAEALAGADVVSQAKNFNNALGYKRKLDGFIISKMDTVGNVIGTIVSITWATGIPIIFIGNGQTYTDIRVLSVSWAVKMLMN